MPQASKSKCPNFFEVAIIIFLPFWKDDFFEILPKDFGNRNNEKFKKVSSNCMELKVKSVLGSIVLWSG